MTDAPHPTRHASWCSAGSSRIHLAVGGALRELHIVRALAETAPTYVFGLAPGGSAPPDTELAGWQSSRDPTAALAPQGEGLRSALRAGESPFHVPVSDVATAELDEVLESFAPDVILVRGPEVSGYIPQLRVHCPRLVLDCDYGYAASFRDMGSLDPNRARGMSWRHAAELVAKREADDLRQVDQIWVSHTQSRDTLRASYTDLAPMIVIPNVVDVESYAESTRADSGNLLYVGRFDFWPNEQAADILVHEIMPRLEHASLSLVGIAPTPWMRELDDPRITVTGAVDDIRPFYQRAGMLVVPLHAGSGTRLKVLEAFAAAVPVVSTEKGVEGLDLVDDVHYVRAESTEEFVTAINGLRRDTARAERVARAGHALVETRFSLALEQLVRDALAALTYSTGTA